jgi:D-alanyl-D-alanine carboxypeptidase (penicillin-binding protein 5/6)
LPLRAVLLAGALLFAPLPGLASPAASPLDRFPGLARAYAVRIDGDLVWGAAVDAPRPPASLVKLLTALELLRDPRWDPLAVVTVSPAAAAIEGTRIGLRKGERLRAGDLLTGMLVRSGNDACLALVEHQAADIAAMAQRLARRARQLGLRHSRFLHPCGLDAPGQQTTARDLLALADAALAEPEIRLRARAPSAEVRTLDGRWLRFRNTNALIGRSRDAVGLKTGYTSKAGRCLIAVGESGGHQVVIVLLDAPNRWWEAAGLVEQGLGYAKLRAAGR